MSFHFFDYKILNNFETSEIYTKNSEIAIVFDQKPQIPSESIVSYDINNFKILSWKNKFSSKTVAFQIKKFSSDLVNAFFKNSYKEAFIFTDDEEFKGLFEREVDRYKIIYLNEVEQLTEPEFTKLYQRLTIMGNNNLKSAVENDSNLYKAYSILASYFSLLNFKINQISILSKRYTEEGFSCSVYHRSKSIQPFIFFNLPHSSEVTNFKNSLCFVFDFDENFDYKKFDRCIFFEYSENPKYEISFFNENQSSFESLLINNPFSFNNNNIDSSSNINIPLILEDVKHSTTKQLFVSSLLSPSYSSSSLQQSFIGNVSFPLSSSRQVLEFILHSIKNILESHHLYLRSILPTLRFSQGGFMDKEFLCTISIPGLFDFEVAGDHAITKKDASSTACSNTILRLMNSNILDGNILDGNLDVIEENLLSLKSVRNLFIKAYKTDDPDLIKDMREKFMKTRKEKTEGLMIEKEGILQLCKTVDEGDLFKRKYMIDLAAVEANGINLSIEDIFRKIPDCVSTISNFMSLSTFSNSNTGILYFKNNIEEEYCEVYSRDANYCPNRNNYTNTNYYTSKKDDCPDKILIKNFPPREYSTNEIHMIKFYQIIFFKMHGEIFPSESQTHKLFYYAVPVINNNNIKDLYIDNDNMVDVIDWGYLEKIYSNFLSDFVYNRTIENTLIWNPFTREFLIYIDKLDKELNESVDGITFLDYFEKKYRIKLNTREGKLIFKAYTAEQIASMTRKHFNNNINNKENKEVVEYIEELEEKEFVNRNTNSSNINTNIISKKKKGVAVIYSTECCFITPVNLTIFREIEIFKRNYLLIEDLFIAQELKSSFSLPSSPASLIPCFTQSSVHPTQNYERLEFLGDCILKFFTTNFLYLSEISMDYIVSVKDSVISNQNLFKICFDSGIYRYLSTTTRSLKNVQAPCIEGMEELMEYFNCQNIFKSDNYSQGISNTSENKDKAVKHYADMIEALIGRVFLSGGMKEAIKFIYRLGILIENKGEAMRIESINSNSNSSGISINSSNNSNNSSINNSNSNNINNNIINNINDVKMTNFNSMFPNKKYKFFEFQGFLSESDIKSVEKIICYKFNNPGNLERALIHPSFSILMGHVDFQYLELLGDCSLDLFITTLLFSDENINTPLLLHSSKKAYVNNSALYKFFYKVELDRYAKFVLPKGIPCKTYSDFVEALIGAILVDLEWNYEGFIEVMHRKIRFVLEETKSELDLM